MILDNDTFIEQLIQIYKLQKTKKTGSVWVTFKQVKEWIKRSERKEGDEPQAPIGCLVRATNGSKKISTLVKPKESGKFNEKLTKVMNTYFALIRK